jgi:hypothetical protein
MGHKQQAEHTHEKRKRLGRGRRDTVKITCELVSTMCLKRTDRLRVCVCV